MTDYPKVYEGSEPYVFISYAHKDTDIVLPLIKALIDKDYRVWYDGGLECGTEWPEMIADHLEKCACVIVFLSENTCNSKNCRKEIAFAENLESVSLLVVYLSEDFEIPKGVKLQLGLGHAIYRNRHKSDASFIEELVRSEYLEKCKNEILDPKEYDPEWADRYVVQGDFYMENNMFLVAEEAYLHAIAIYERQTGKTYEAYEPDLARTYGKLGKHYHDKARYDEAQEMYGKVVILYGHLAVKDAQAYEPALAECYHALGHVYAMIKQYDDAEKMFKKALEIRKSLVLKNLDAYLPELISSYYNLGDVYLKQKKRDEMKHAFLAVLSLCERLNVEERKKHRLMVAWVRMHLENEGNV